jgi:hypothetical protein
MNNLHFIPDDLSLTWLNLEAAEPPPADDSAHDGRQWTLSLGAAGLIDDDGGRHRSPPPFRFADGGPS